MNPTPSLQRRRRHLHFDALIADARHRFERLPEPRRSPIFPLADALMAGLALFCLKDPSLLAFQRRAHDHNLRSVFGLHAIPSDTQMRVILDEVPPDQLRPAFRDVFRALQRGKVLEDFVFLDGCYLIALDGVEYFRSDTVHCDHCLTRQHDDGTVSYYHQMLGAALVHPDRSEVIPLAPEPIQRDDGSSKNDCERNAARRWLRRFRREHPHLPVIITEDALSSNAPHLRDLQAARVHFLLGVKPGDHAHLFAQVAARVEDDQVDTWEEVEASTQTRHSYLFTHDVVLNEANADVRVNFLQYVQSNADGSYGEWSWVTDLVLSKARVPRVMRGGRARWRIENETFNTLKNQGYHFEHNFGHGEKNLGTVFALLMVLAFLMDQVQQTCDPLFKAAWARKGPKCALWESVRHLFASFDVGSMREVYEAIAYSYERPRLKPLIAYAAAAAGQQADDTS